MVSQDWGKSKCWGEAEEDRGCSTISWCFIWAACPGVSVEAWVVDWLQLIGGIRYRLNCWHCILAWRGKSNLWLVTIRCIVANVMISKERASQDPVINCRCWLSNDLDPAYVFICEIVVATFNVRSRWNFIGVLSVDEKLKIADIAVYILTWVINIALIFLACNIIIFGLKILSELNPIRHRCSDVLVTRVDEDFNVELVVANIPKSQLLDFYRPFVFTCSFEPDWFSPATCIEAFVWTS